MEVKSYYFHYQLLKTLAAEVVIVKRTLLLSDWAVWTLSVKKVFLPNKELLRTLIILKKRVL